jgi:cytochrome b involved in lipid metabolism
MFSNLRKCIPSAKISTLSRPSLRTLLSRNISHRNDIWLVTTRHFNTFSPLTPSKKSLPIITKRSNNKSPSLTATTAVQPHLCFPHSDPFFSFTHKISQLPRKALVAALCSAATIPIVTPTSSPDLQYSPFLEEIEKIETLSEFDEKFKHHSPETIFPNLPIYTISDVKAQALNNSDKSRIIIIQGSYIYDLTEFLEVHPGGAQLLKANYDAADPFWLIYPVHRTSPNVWLALNQYRVGILDEEDRKVQETKMDKLRTEHNKIFWKYEPLRSKKLRYLGVNPCNAETPLHLIYNKFITPNDYWFIRNHHPAPVSQATPPKPTDINSLNDDSTIFKPNEFDIMVDGTTGTWFLPPEDFGKYPLRFEISKKLFDCGSNKGKSIVSIPIIDKPNEFITVELGYDDEGDKYHTVLTIDQMSQIIKHDSLTATIICSGNRRNEMNVSTGFKTDGLSWGYGAISTGEFEGVKLATIFDKVFGVNFLNMSPFYNQTPTSHEQPESVPHCIVRALDAPFDTSFPLSHILNPQNDVLLSFSQNKELLSPDQGYPLKLVAPGSTGNRQVKWLKSITLDFQEAESSWHVNKPYRHSGPATQANKPVSALPPVYFWPVFSNILYPSFQNIDDPNVNPSQQTGPLTPAIVTPKQCGEETIASLMAQLGRKGGTKESQEDLMKKYRCIDVAGYAYVGNGVGISRIDTAIIGKSDEEFKNGEDPPPVSDINNKDIIWTEAKIQRTEDPLVNTPLPSSSSAATTVHNHWAWVLFKSEVILPESIKPGQEVFVTSKAVDNMFNSQPRTIEAMWNGRGILNNSWCKYPLVVGDSEHI